MNTEDIKLLQGDCLELMKEIPEKSIDMILCDLPYGVLNKNNKNAQWDNILPFDKLWKQYERIIKDNSCVALFCDGLFMAELMVSNKKMWKYNLVWNKIIPSGFLNANRMPLRETEEIAVFYKKQPIYNAQKSIGEKNHSKGKVKENKNNNYGKCKFVDNSEKLGNMKCPTSLISFSKTHPSQMIHPTQKPVALLEYLIKTYTNENMVVLDNCMGSGSTGVACINTKRKFIGIELDQNYFNIAKKRIEDRLKQQELF